jgi:hypothetical protein
MSDEDDKCNVVELFAEKDDDLPLTVSVLCCNYCEGDDFTLYPDQSIACSTCGADGLTWVAPEGLIEED